jgi:hypothetical protein
VKEQVEVIRNNKQMAKWSLRQLSLKAVAVNKLRFALVTHRLRNLRKLKTCGTKKRSQNFDNYLQRFL